MQYPGLGRGGGNVVIPASGGGGGGHGGIVDSFIHHLISNPVTQNWVTHELDKTVTNLKDVALGAPAGFWHLGGSLLHNPVGTAESLVTQPIHVLEHPLRDPGYSLLALGSLIPTPLSAGFKLADIAAIAARAGELTPEMAALTAGAEPGAAAAELAGQAGKFGEYARAVHVTGDRAGQSVGVGRQILTRTFKGLPQEERLLKVPREPEDIAAQAAADRARGAEPSQLSLEDIASGTPAPSKGMVRLYRATGRPDGPIPNWMKGQVTSESAQGRWFTNDLAEAKWYQAHEGGRITHIDVPAGEAEAFRVSNLGGDAASFSRRPEKEFFVPREWASRSKELNEPFKDPTHIPGEQGGELSNPEYLIQRGAKYSRDPTIKAAQKLVDKLYNRYPDDTAPMPWVLARKVLGGSMQHRIGQARKAQEIEIQKTFTREGAALQAKYGKLPDAVHLAARMVLEGTLPHMRAAFHQRMLDSGSLTPRGIAETKKMLDLIPQAAEHLDTKTYTLADGSTHVLPVLKESSSDLEPYLTDLRSLAAKRTLGAKTAGVLNNESALSRVLGPLNLVVHGRMPENVTRLKNQIAGYQRQHMHAAAEVAQRKLDEELGQMHFDSLQPHEQLYKGDLGSELVNQAGLVRVPYNYASKRLVDFGSTSFRRAYRGGRKAPPGTFTHHFNATVLKHGGGEQNVAKLMAESFTEAQRFLGFKALRDHILAAAQDTPEGIPEDHRRLVRDESNPRGGAVTHQAAFDRAQRPKLTKEQQLLDTDEAALSQQHTIWGGKLYEGMRAHFFPNDAKVEEELGPSLADRLLGRNGQKYQAVPGYKWIDDRMLGGLDKSNPLFGAFENKWTRKAIHTVDGINAVQKAMILYLKPAYIVPNLLSNTALAFIHQGFLAPWNIARSFKMFNRMSPETVAGIKSLVGEGFTSSGLKGGGLGAAIHRGTEKAAKFYGKVVDDPLRFAAFLHEASLSGFNSGAELDALLRDPRFSSELQNISSRANESMINYERLSPGEQAVMKRLVFFYPWVKGSTRYVNLYLKEHPTGAGIQGSAGQEGTDWIKRTLGEVPSYEEGIFPFSTKNPNFPTVINPSSASIFGEPAHIAEILRNTVHGNPLSGLAGASELTPTDAGFLALLTAGKETTVAHPANQPVLESAAQEMFGGNPLFTLINQLEGRARGGGPLQKSLFPDARLLPVINRFAGLGGLQSTIYNRAMGEAKAKKEQQPTGFVGGG